MKLIGKVSVFPKLPKRIERLHELAYNLWWSWETEAQALFATIDPILWESTNHNPVRFLRSVRQESLNDAAANPEFLNALDAVMAEFDAYISPDADTWFRREHSDKLDRTIAYFSAEFGLHEALPIYSGGLGVLSGDHCKAASDLGLPFVGVGFLYPQGYFTQHIDADGMQQAIYEKVDFAEVPATPALDPNGNEVLINVDLPGRTVYAKVWQIQVGRITIYLMDTDVERNAPQDRELSARLYGGDREMRISQEVVLGIGGVRAVRALGIQPSIWHMNEGHSAFLGLERVREKILSDNLSFDEAVEAVRANSVFTTHTPVPAGNDTFAFELVEKFFWQYWSQLNIDRDRFIDFARQELDWGPQYSMTVLAIRLSAYQNGVSKLHGTVSREMWRFLWPDIPVEETPIGHVTNGIHNKTWMAQELKDLYSEYLPGNWREEVDAPQTWAPIDGVPDAALWEAHATRKHILVEFVRERVQQQYLRHGEGPQRLDDAAALLDPNALTLGFARRFATYKRATLIFRDEERLLRILNNPERPVQIVFSGKAHPADEPGKSLIQHIYKLSQRPEFEGKIVFVENYDMNIARHLISGVDVWLNNPRRPHEASGTSGEKAAASGVPNLSVLDGWWVEGYDGSNGWSIGEEREYKDQETQDEADALSLYQLLESELVPLFYDRGEDGIPRNWVQKMKNSIRSCAPRFSMARMVKDYVNQLYLPAAVSGERYQSNGFAVAKSVSAWKSDVRNRWPSVNIDSSGETKMYITVGESLSLSAKLWPGRMELDELAVEIVYGLIDEDGKFIEPQVSSMTPNGREDAAIRFTGSLTPSDSGQIAIAIRVRPIQDDLIHAHEMGLSRWA